MSTESQQIVRRKTKEDIMRVPGRYSVNIVEYASINEKNVRRKYKEQMGSKT